MLLLFNKNVSLKDTDFFVQNTYKLQPEKGSSRLFELCCLHASICKTPLHHLHHQSPLPSTQFRDNSCRLSSYNFPMPCHKSTSQPMNVGWHDNSFSLLKRLTWPDRPYFPIFHTSKTLEVYPDYIRTAFSS